MKEIDRRYKYAVILALNAIVYAALNILFPCRFETNDDVTMAWIASGVYTGTPEPHLVYINYLYGVVVAFLYRLLPEVEWYTLVFACIHVFSSSVICACLLKTCSFGRVGKALSLLAFYLMYVYTALYLEFTTVAVVCAIAGLLLISSGSHRWLGVGAFVLASLVRFDAAMMVGLVYAFFYPKEIMSHRACRKTFTALVVSCVLALGLDIVDGQIYATNPRWAEFKSYNESRGVADDPLFRVYAQGDVAGISDVNMLHVLNFTLDESAVTEQQLREASEIVHQGISLEEKCRVALSQIKEPKYLYAIILLVVYSFAVSVSEKKKFFLPTFLPCILVIAVMFVIAAGAYLKYRVFIGLILSSFVFVSVTCSSGQNADRSVFAKYVVVGSLVLLSLLWGKREVANFRKEMSAAPAARENLAQFKKVASCYPNTLTFDCVPIESVNPWVVTKDSFSNDVEEMWWMSKWPTHTQLHSHKDILTNQIVICTLSDGWWDVGQFFCESIKSNYGIDAVPHLLFESGGIAGVVILAPTCIAGLH